MRKLSWLDKIIFFFNSLAAAALLLSYLVAYIPPKSFPLISVLSLGVPILLILNAFFLVYWLLRLKRQILLSAIVLLIGYSYIGSFYKFTSEKADRKEAGQLSIMSYNVRMFNAYKWVKDETIPEQIVDFITGQDPDILLTQEHYVNATNLKEIYPHHYVYQKHEHDEFGMAVFSKYPILKRFSVDFPHNGNNNSIYTDVLVNEDTLRIFNVHLQSLNIKPEIHELRQEDGKKLFGRIGGGFAMQQEQVELMMDEVNESPHKTLVIGDFNNTTFSYIYKEVNKNERFKDAFLEAGSGFGQTFNLSYFPLRIDFMLIDQDIEIESFKRYKINLSDHFPIMTRLRL